MSFSASLDSHNTPTSSASSSSPHVVGAEAAAGEEVDPSMYFHGLQNFKGPTHWGVADGTGGRAHNNTRSNGNSSNDNDAGNHGSTDSIVEEEDYEGAASLSREEMDNGLPLDAPVVVVLHGIGGTAHDP